MTTRREGTRVWYSLAGDDVAALFTDLRAVAAATPPAHRGRTSRLPRRRRHRAGRPATSCSARAETGDAVVLDVRPDTEYAAGHLPGAVNIPLEQLEDRLTELPADREVVAYCRGAYCVLAHDAVRLLAAHGRRARRATDGILEWRVAGLPALAGAA